MKKLLLMPCFLISLAACTEQEIPDTITLDLKISGSGVASESSAVSSSSASSDPVELSSASSISESSSSAENSSSSVPESSSSEVVASSSSVAPYAFTIPHDCDQRHDCAALDFDSVPAPAAGYSEPKIRPSSADFIPNSDIGAFRTDCTPSHFSFNDPLVFPGQDAAAHFHMFFGNTDVDAFTDTLSIAETGNSTCKGGTANRSAYWIPALIDMNSGELQIPLKAIWYYKEGYNGLSGSTFGPLPEGLAMISSRAHWLCRVPLNGNPAYYRYDSIPAGCPAGEYVTMVVDFPQCYAPGMSYKDDQSHVAFPSNRACPDSHPYVLPQITLNVRYTVPDDQSQLFWRLSSDMHGTPAGSSAHADWINGWNPETSNTWIENCLNSSADCHSNLLGEGNTLY